MSSEFMEKLKGNRVCNEYSSPTGILYSEGILLIIPNANVHTKNIKKIDKLIAEIGLSFL